MTGANMHLVTVDIEVAADAPPPEPKLDEGEHIVQRVVRLKDLDAMLKGESHRMREESGDEGGLMVDYDKRGFAIDALVASVAAGLTVAA